MQKFLVLYMAPAADLGEWMKMPEEMRKEQEEKMKTEWDAWMKEHGKMFSGATAGTGKTKRVTKGAVTDVKNDVMLYSIVEGESQEEVANTFKDHPHFGIPTGWIDIMPINYLPGMEGM